ncbi:MAG: type II secretion system F family protein [Sedimentisphaerales bacterium]|nr:type II secretion system F family protein [Sedimentisphaerales bacterium]MBN2843903.1 type II secretion system F family protein [Sedimentisphaerales bacterium]
MNFRYELKQNNGQITTGTIVAADAGAATKQLKAQGGYIISLSELAQSEKTTLQKILEFKIERGPNAKDVLNFTSQLAVMIKAGISIRPALDGIADQVENRKFREMLLQVKQDIEAGRSFSESLSRHPKTFPPLYINMIKASELSGSFGGMLERIAAYLEQQIETRSQVRSAMVYPIIIAVMAVVTTVFLLTFVLPRFVAVFEGKEDALPIPTKIILFMSFCFRKYWYLILAGTGGLGWLIAWAINTGPGRVWWDKTKLKIPVMSKLFRSLYISRSMHTMGELVNAGVPMLDTIHITANIAGNVIYKRMWHQVYVSVKQGKKICEPLSQSDLLPKSVIQMISSGEESGKLAEVMNDISEYYQRELKNTIRAVTSMIEPMMIVLMGGIVGFIAMSIILPIFKMSSMVKG